MDSFEEAKSLINDSKNKYEQIKISYQKSIDKQEIDNSLKIEIKNFMGNIRSALDYTIVGLYDKYAIPINRNIYFPYADIKDYEDNFRKKSRILKTLQEKEPLIVDIICKYQHFSSPKNYWMPLFMKLNNENKHMRLSPQYKSEKKELSIRINGVPAFGISGNGKMTINGTVHAINEKGEMASVHFDNQEASVDKPMKIKDKNVQQFVRKIISFNFEENNQPVMKLLKDSLDGAGEIIDKLSGI